MTGVWRGRNQVGMATWERPQARPVLKRGRARAGHGPGLLHGHPLVSPGLVPKNSVLSANLKQMDSHSRMADDRAGSLWVPQRLSLCSLFRVQV